MKLKQTIVAIALVGIALGCTTPAYGPGGGSSHPAGTCSSQDNWALGDSFTSGVHGIPGWPDQNPPIPAGTYANKGYGGRTIDWLADQLALDLAACGPGQLPQTVVFHGGANDIGDFNLALVQMQADVAGAVATAANYGVDLVLVPVLPIPAWSDWATLNSKRVSYNNHLASTYPSMYVNCSSPLLDPANSIYLNPAYAYGDRTHLNDAGAEVLAGCIDAAV